MKKLWPVKCKPRSLGVPAKFLKGVTDSWGMAFLSSFILTMTWNAELRAGALTAILDHEVPLRMEATTKDGDQIS